jgi:hypothetical protein
LRRNIGIEDPHMKGMMGNRRLARSIADMVFLNSGVSLSTKGRVSGRCG